MHQFSIFCLCQQLSVICQMLSFVFALTFAMTMCLSVFQKLLPELLPANALCLLLLLPFSVFLFTLISTVWHSHCRCLCPRALLIRSVCPVSQPGLSVSQAVCQSVSEALSRFPQLPAPPLFVCVFLLLFRFCFCCYCFKRNFPLV